MSIQQRITKLVYLVTKNAVKPHSYLTLLIAYSEEHGMPLDDDALLYELKNGTDTDTLDQLTKIENAMLMDDESPVFEWNIQDAKNLYEGFSHAHI